MERATPNDWARVGEEIQRRMAELSLTKAELLRSADLSDKTLAGYLAGKPIVRADKRRTLSGALGWTVESIDLILAGGNPVLVGDPDPSDPESRLN